MKSSISVALFSLGVFMLFSTAAQGETVLEEQNTPKQVTDGIIGQAKIQWSNDVPVSIVWDWGSARQVKNFLDPNADSGQVKCYTAWDEAYQLERSCCKLGLWATQEEEPCDPLDFKIQWEPRGGKTPRSRNHVVATWGSAYFKKNTARLDMTGPQVDTLFSWFSRHDDLKKNSKLDCKTETRSAPTGRLGIGTTRVTENICRFHFDSFGTLIEPESFQ